MDVSEHNRIAWNKQVYLHNPFTLPVTSEEVARARDGEIHLYLTPSKPVPKGWIPRLQGAHVLCLASGGGQQGPILAAAGADVTVYDISEQQLAQDQYVAQRDRLEIKTVRGDMRDLVIFADESFDVVINPVSVTYIPNVQMVWKEAFRVLRSGGTFLTAFDNPLVHIFLGEAYEDGEVVISHPIPYSDIEALDKEQIAKKLEEGKPLQFGHTLDELIGGQIKQGFVITGLFEDRHHPQSNDILSRFIATHIATRAVKPRQI